MKFVRSKKKKTNNNNKKKGLFKGTVESCDGSLERKTLNVGSRRIVFCAITDSRLFIQP